MSPTTGYAAAIDTGDIIMSYAKETAWGSKPAVQFQDIRLDSEGFSSSKSRMRPGEINSSGQASQAITTKQESPGSLNFSVSAGTHNDLIASSLGGEFAAAPSDITGTTIAATADSFTGTGKFGGLVVGQAIKVSGFANAALNRIYQVIAQTADEIHVVPAPAATESAGASVTIVGSAMLRNGTVFQSFHFQKQLSAVLFLIYAGSWPTGGSFDVGVSDYLKGTLSFINKDEVEETTDQSTGAHLAAPTGVVIDSINGIGTVFRNGAAIAAAVQKIGVKWNKEGARGQYAIGSAAAQGIGKGQLVITGNLTTYFKDFSLYDEFKNETGGPIWFSALDNAGKGYVITVCNATVMNPKITAGGPNQDVMADFELEGNPDTSNVYGGKTIQIDYFD